MKNCETFAFVCGLMVGLGLALAFAVAESVRSVDAKTAVQMDAASHGVGRYVADPETGKRRFFWVVPVNQNGPQWLEEAK